MSDYKKPHSPTFFVVEGLDGAGKTMVSDHLYKRLTEAGYQVCRTREPGGTVFSEAIRGVFKGNTGKDADDISHALLMNAARRDHVQKVIRPALERGEVVLCDRYVQTTLAFQGDSPDVLAACDIGMDGMSPTATILLECAPTVAVERLKRSQGRDSDWLDNSGLEIFTKRAEGYRKTSDSYFHYGMPLVVVNNIDNARMFLQQIDKLVDSTLLPHLAGVYDALWQTAPFLIDLRRRMNLNTQPGQTDYDITDKTKAYINVHLNPLPQLMNQDKRVKYMPDVRFPVSVASITGIETLHSIPFAFGLVLWQKAYSKPQQYLRDLDHTLYGPLYRALVGKNQKTMIDITYPEAADYFQFLWDLSNCFPLSCKNIAFKHDVDGGQPDGLEVNHVMSSADRGKTFRTEHIDKGIRILVKALGRNRYYMAWCGRDGVVNDLWIGNDQDVQKEVAASVLEDQAVDSKDGVVNETPDYKWTLSADLEKQSKSSQARKLAIIFGDNLVPSRYLAENAQLREVGQVD